MIKTRIRCATESGRYIYVNLEPKTFSDAKKNLKAFAVECGEEKPRPSDWKPLNLRPLINDCFGWTEMSLGDTYAALKCASKKRGQFEVDRAYADLDKNESCFAIVYSFIPEDTLDASIVQEQLDFFHLAGFVLVPFRDQNWKGKGTLVDFSDLIAPHSQGWWRVEDYQRMDVGWHFAELQKWCVLKQ